MRSMTIRGLALAACTLAGGAQAAATFDTSISCGRALALNTTATGLSISCQGALGFSGGSIVADEALSFYSDTSITLIDVLIKGTTVALYAPLIQSESTASLQGDTINLQNTGSWPVPTPVSGGDVQLSPGAVLAIGQPSPSTPQASDLQLQQTGTSPTTVKLEQGGTIVLSNSAGVGFSISGVLSPAQWGEGGTPPGFQIQSAVPEPGTWALMAAGLGVMALAVSRQRQRRG